MIEMAPRITTMGDDAAGPPVPARPPRTVSPLLDLGRGSHVLAREVVAVQCLSPAGDWQSRFRGGDQPLASVLLRGGAVLPAFRGAGELRDEWERSLVVFGAADLPGR